MRLTTYNVIDRRINWVDGTNITGNQNVDKFHFDFDTEWNEFEAKFFVLIVDGVSYIDQLDENNEVTLRSIAYDKQNVEFGVYGIHAEDNEESSKLSTNIVGMETTESIWGKIRDISDLPDKTQWEIYTEEMLGLLAQGQITLEQCEQALTDAQSARDTAERYRDTTQGYMETTEGYKNTTKGYMDDTEGYKNDTAQLKRDTQGIVDDFNANVQQKTTDFNNNAVSKTNAFNQNATDKTDAFNLNATNKTGDFDTNATNKTNAFDGNATDKTTDFNTNASNKTGDFNSNAIGKTTDFNTNYVNKLNDFNENAESYAEFDEKVLESWPKGTATGSSIDLDDSSSFPMKKVGVICKTSQVHTTGKNLFDKDNVAIREGYMLNDNGEEVDNSNYGYTTTFYNVSSEVDYTIQGTFASSNRQSRIYYYNSSDELLSRSSVFYGTYTFTTPVNCTKIRFQVSLSDYKPSTIMIEEGSTASDYEPYTGLQAAPNPQYPQTIHNVSGDVDVESSNKNLFDKNTVTISYLKINGETATTPSSADWRTSDFIGIEPSTIYTTSGMTLPGTGPSRCYYDENKNFISGYQHNGLNPFIDTSPSTARYMKESLHGNDLDTVMIEKSDTASNYEPHQGESITFPLSAGQKMYEGDYLADDGIHSLWTKTTVDSSNVDNLFSDFATEDNLPRLGGLKSKVNCIASSTINKNIMLMTKYKEATSAIDKSFRTNRVQYYYYIYDSSFEDLADAKSKVIGLEILCKMPNEVITPYTEAQQTAWNNIKKLQTYKNITHILTSSDDLAPNLDIIYYKDLETVIDNIGQAIIARDSV